MGTFSITEAVAAGMLSGTPFATSLGTSPNLVIYSGTPPTNARTALSGNTVLATLPCAATPISGVADNGSTGVVATYAAIGSATASATGTATFFRHLTSGGTVIDQGAVGTSGADCNLNTTAITAGSTVSITSDTMTLPYGP
jgi:hypothetical protein